MLELDVVEGFVELCAEYAKASAAMGALGPAIIRAARLHAPGVELLDDESAVKAMTRECLDALREGVSRAA
jgi:hypothetical protein